MPDNHHKLAQEEIFGPVLTVIKVKDDQEAIDIANDSEYGLAGGVFSQNITRALNIAKAVVQDVFGLILTTKYQKAHHLVVIKNQVSVEKLIKVR